MGPSLGAPQSSGPACRILDVEMGNDLGPFSPVAVWLHPLKSGSLGPPHISMCLGAPWRVTAGMHEVKTEWGRGRWMIPVQDETHSQLH